MPHCQQLSATQLQALQAEGKAVIIDIRSLDEYEEEHIIDALSMPVSDIMSAWFASIASDQHIVFYCRVGNRTRIATPRLLGLNLTHMAILKEGLDGWKAMGGKTESSL